MPNIGRETDEYSYYFQSPPNVSDFVPRTSYGFFCAGGALRCTVSGTEYSLLPGDLLIILPGEELLAETDGSTHRFLRVKREFVSGVSADGIRAVHRFVKSGKRYIPAFLFELYRLDVIFDEVTRYATRARDDSDEMIRLLSSVLFLKLREIYICNDLEDSSQPKPGSYRICAYINENLTRPITLDTIASYMYMDKSYICRIFKRDMGMTINAYLTNRRIALAKRLINRDRRLKDVYRDCGFKDYSTFYRAFLKYSGMTPEHFKERTADEEAIDN